mgnify:CR=1 FL=1
MKFFTVFRLSPLAGLFKEKPQQEDENTIVVNGVEGNTEAVAASEPVSPAPAESTPASEPVAPAPNESSPAEAVVEAAPAEVPEAAPEGPTTHTVKLTNAGFEQTSLTIKAGDSVEWRNERTATLKTGFMIGTRLCRDLRSAIFHPNESYSYTFATPMTCVVTDGIYTKSAMTVTVE